MHGLPPCVLSEYFSCVLVVYVMRKASGGVCVWGGGSFNYCLMCSGTTRSEWTRDEAYGEL